MRIPSTLTAAGLLILTSCSSSDKPVAEPTPAETPAAAAASGHLKIVPFVMTTTGTKADGTTKVRVIRGDANGVISMEADGIKREAARVSSDGTFTPLEDTPANGASLKLQPSGELHVNGVPVPGLRVGDDGTLYQGQEVMLRIEGNQVVDVRGDILESKVSMNGEVVSKTTFTIVIEGGNDAHRLVGAMLAIQLGAGAQPSKPTPSTTEATAEPAPATP